MIAIALFVLALASRLFIHVPNFTPVIAVALFAGIYLNKRWAVVLPLAIMAISDIFIGFHQTMVFTWGALVLAAFIGLNVRNRKTVKNVFFGSLGSAVLFFIVTNFGVWLMMGMYAKSFAGLLECYLMAIPFFRSTLLSTLVYTFVLCGVYEFLSLKLKNTSFAHAL